MTSSARKEAGLSREISRREAAPQPIAQAGQTSKAVGALGEVGVARSSIDPEKNERSGEPRGGTWTHATKSSEGQGDGCPEGEYLFEQIGTPVKVRKLQLALYRKAKARLSRRPTDEESSESRMREIRLSGLMRGGEVNTELTTTVC